jgi:hypothetical protein
VEVDEKMRIDRVGEGTNLRVAKFSGRDTRQNLAQRIANSLDLVRLD